MVLETIVASVLNRLIGTYFEGVNTKDLNFGIWSGESKLRHLKLKKEALDRFHLPVDVKEGYLGELTVAIPWSNVRITIRPNDAQWSSYATPGLILGHRQLKGKPVRIVVENVYLLAAPASPDAHYDPQDEARRAQAVKLDKLTSAEMLTAKPSAGMSAEDEAKNESFAQSLLNRTIDNVQITVKNVHLRYEDNVSVPGHPFSIGITLAGFTADSTDSNWMPTYIHNSADGVHKLAQLDSLGMYFDSDSKSLAGHAPDEAIRIFTEAIGRTDEKSPRESARHQYILSPVSGTGRLVWHHHVKKALPKVELQLLFKELAFAIDDEQYRDALSMVDLFHFYTRRKQYRKHRPTSQQIEQNKPKALLNFAQSAILHEVHERRRKWTWDYFKERRDDRKLYIYSFKLQARGEGSESDKQTVGELEEKLSYSDLRFYRSIARSELRKEKANAKQTEEQKALQGTPQGKGKSGSSSGSGWFGWVWGGAKTQAHKDADQPQDLLSDEQRKELYDAIDFNDKAAPVTDYDLPKDTVKAKLIAKLDTGSFTLKRDPHRSQLDLLKVIFDAFSLDAVQRSDNLEASLALQSMSMYDGTRADSVHKQIVRVKQNIVGNDRGSFLVEPTQEGSPERRRALDTNGDGRVDDEDPFFVVKFEKNPLDERADTGLTVRMRYMEIVYHRGYIEEIVRFFRPPASQLESVNALVDAASETLEGIRKETRAGLEFALQNHRTVDLQVDMNAPIIIIPEDVSRLDCQHIVLDAGYIAISSDLVPKAALAEIKSKENKSYTDADFERLEALVYDKYHIELKSAQLLLGNSLDACMSALGENGSPHIHVLEKLNIAFVAETCIVPNAPNLTRLRIAGGLPNLHVHFSDRKYKSLMRMIDVALPKFDTPTASGQELPSSLAKTSSHAPQATSLDPARFKQAPLYPEDDAISLGDDTDVDSHGEDHDGTTAVDTDDQSDDQDKDIAEDDQFFEAGDIVEGNSNHLQKSFEFSFRVDRLQASIYKADVIEGRPDRILVDAILDTFDFAFALRPFDMGVDISLRSFIIEDLMVQSGSRFPRLVTSDDLKDSSANLVNIRYARVNPDSPDFMTVHEGNNQSVDVELSTISLIVTRASILMLFDWLLTTFTGGPNAQTPHTEQSLAEQRTSDDHDVHSARGAQAVEQPVSTASSPLEKLRIKVKLKEVRAILNDDGTPLATLALQAADASLLLRGPSMRFSARLGNISMRDDYEYHDRASQYIDLLEIEGKNLADFQYEKLDPADAENRDFDTTIYLRSGSLCFTFVEEPVHRILRFLTKFSRMKAVYDATASAAANQAANLQQQANRMQYDILVNTPIILIPGDAQSPDRIAANLGEISLKNHFKKEGSATVSHVKAALRKIRLTSLFLAHNELLEAQMLENVDVTFSVTQTVDIAQERERRQQSRKPDTEITGKMSDVRMELSATQYTFLLHLSRLIPRAFSTSEIEAREDAELQASIDATQPQAAKTASYPSRDRNKVAPSESVDLFPELAIVTTDQNGDKVYLYSTLEFAFSVKKIHLELFTDGSEQNLKGPSLARFTLNQTDTKFKMLNNGSMDAEVLLRSFTVHDTRPEAHTKFREILPATRERGYQLMVSYTMSGGIDRSAMANVTIDTPSLIFSLDPLFALLKFVTTPLPDSLQGSQLEPQAGGVQNADEDVDKTMDAPRNALAYRVNIVAASVKLLADPTRTDSEAIVLSIRQIQMAQQGTLVLSIDHLGIFLCSMNKPQDKVRILDDFDLNLSMDNRHSHGKSNMSIELDVQAIVLRISNRDVLLVTSIVGKAIELSNSDRPRTERQSKSAQNTSRLAPSLQAGSTAVALPGNGRAFNENADTSSDRAQLILTRESLRAVFGGFRMVLISDLHELPMLDLTAPKFTARVEDWSADLKSNVAITPVINYYNLLNSRWEALMEPWDFRIDASKSAATQAMSVIISSRKRLELNVTHTFIELAMNTLSLMSQKNEELMRTSRGSNAPFMIRNRTGHSLTFWAESDGDRSRSANTILADGKDTPWRLDDWKAMRESATTNVIHNSMGIRLNDTSWEQIKHISVEREGEQTYRLKPRVDRISHRLLCECKLINNIKVVTFRSTFKIENLTLVPSEIVVVNSEGKRASAIFKLPPGGECSVPIELAMENRIKIRPDPGHGYHWSLDSYHWADFSRRPSRVVICKSREKETSFRYQMFADIDKRDASSSSYPRLTVRVRAPIEVENLLPYDIRFRVYDKNREHNWSSFLRKGGTTPLHMADLSHLLLLSVEIQDTLFRRSEFAIVNTDNPDDLPIEEVLPMQDRDGLKVDLQIHYERYPASGGAFKIQIYSPYVIYNRTGLAYALQSKSAMPLVKGAAAAETAIDDAQHQDDDRPALFSFRSRSGANRVYLSIAESAWSSGLSFETVGTESEVTLTSSSGQEQISIGMKVSEGVGNYKFVKVITFYPRYVIKNSLDRPICVRPNGSTYKLSLQPGERQPLHWLKAGAEPMIVMSYPDINQWTSPIKMRDVGELHVRILDDHGNEQYLRCEMAIGGAVVFITLLLETRGAPIQIMNDSEYAFIVSQKAQSSPSKRKDRQYRVGSGCKLEYAWDRPADAEKLLVLTLPDGKTRDVNIMEIGSQPPVKFSSGNTSRVVSVDILAEGHQQVLRLTNFDESRSLFKLQRRDTSMSMTRTSSQNSAVQEFETKDTTAPITLSFTLALEGVGVSVINAHLVELVYASFRGIKLKYEDTAVSQTVSFTLKWIQVDNQLFGGIYPLLFYPSVIPKDEKELEMRPNLEAKVILLKDQAHGVLYFKYLTVLLQEMTIEVDEDFLFALLEFTRFRNSSDTPERSVLIEDTAELPEAPPVAKSTEVYFEDLLLQPIVLNLSFMRTETLNSDQAIFSGSRNAVAYFLNAVTMALGNVNDAPIQLNALIISDVRLSYAVLLQRIVLHYRQGFTNQFYRVLGSADFLGNPIGLFSNVSSGIADLFYEPTEGVVEFRDFGAGLARGAGSFAKKTVFGLTDSMTKVTGSIGKGLSAATLDKRFQSQRRMRQYRNKPRHFLYGMSAGAGSFLNSVGSGIEGLVRHPVEGAEANGAAGFVKGFGKGMVGMATKPFVGLFDFASNVTEGIRNTTTVFDQSAIDRVRLPRLTPADKVLRAYNEREAIGQFWLKNLDNSRFLTSNYVAHLAMAGDNDDLVAFVTSDAILFAKVTKYSLAWHVPMSDLQSISLEANGISLILRGGAQGPFLVIPDQESRLWFFSHIERVVSAYNNQKRLE